VLARQHMVVCHRFVLRGYCYRVSFDRAARN
jgi:hypothetical protein